MAKLIKYEFQKQMFSKLVIVVSLAVLIVLFTYAVLRDDERMAVVVLGVTTAFMALAITYVGIEGAVVYSRDLKTKQSYMLFMVPQSSWSILGAKIIASVLQILFTMFIFTVTLAANVTIFLMRNVGMKELIETGRRLVEMLFHVRIDVRFFVEALVVTFILWVFLFMLAVFVETLLYTVLHQGKLISVLAVVAYFFVFFGAVKLENVCYELVVRIAPVGISELVLRGMSYAYYLALDLILFFVSAWLIEKKLSV
ncbi:MAG: hypothetical protein NC337_02185 [Roseburia sp.]|nr:hypothetical protein [Roseburia sp.]